MLFDCFKVHELLEPKHILFVDKIPTTGVGKVSFIYRNRMRLNLIVLREGPRLETPTRAGCLQLSERTSRWTTQLRFIQY